MKFSLVTILLLIFLSNANCQINSVNSYLHINNSYLYLNCEKKKTNWIIDNCVETVNGECETVKPIYDIELKVPNKVDYEQGENWGDIK